MPQVVRSYLRIVALLPAAGRGLLAALLLVNVLLGLLPVGFVVATSVMIGRVPSAVDGGVGSSAWAGLVTWFGVAAGAFLAQQILAPVQGSLGELMSRRIDGLVYDRLIAGSLRTPGIAPLEDQRLLADLTEATRSLEQAFRTPGNACAAVLALVARYVQLLAFAAIVGFVFSWLAAIALVVATMAFRTGNRGGLRTFGQFFRYRVNEWREINYLRSTAMEARAAKEIRVFGLVDWITERYRAVTLGWLLPMWVERRRVYLKPYIVDTAIGLVVAGSTFAAIGQAAATGSLSLTQLALALQAGLGALNLGQYFPEADTQTEFGMGAYDAVSTFESGIDAYEPPSTARPSGGQAGTGGPSADPAGLPRREIRFEGVAFHYPGSGHVVLDGLDLVLPVGRCTAIVGLNGAGKTTLVKLLARLYEPTAGRLSVDGVDVRDFDVDDWRRRIGVIFQDFNRYELSAAENIGWGAIEVSTDRDRVRQAARRAGVLATLDGMPSGLDTPLSRLYRDGADLSGGQWQRVAIARALFALDSGAGILVLDEPTAALDVRAEVAFFDRFVELTRGVTSVLISHRFSSVRNADRIVVLELGRVVEDGTHDELLELGGRYAELFRLQAERFQEDEAELEHDDEAWNAADPASDRPEPSGVAREVAQ
jgi:ATP-binding cassette subfamily B protein